jgi:molybdopterin converting factor small subunit
MKIKIEFLAQAKLAAGCSSISVDLAPGSTVAAAVDAATSQKDALRELLLTADGKIHPWVLVAVGRQSLSDPNHHVLTADVTLRLMPPISGG